MAMSGKRTPEITDIRKGMPMEEVHLILREYTPVINYNEDKCIEIYDIQIGNDPSLGRAICHGALDLLTWGAWEIIGTPAEAVSSKTMTLTITYKDEIVDSVKCGQEKGGI